MEPISPKDVLKAKVKEIPPEVIGCFNRAIAKNYSRKSASIKCKDIINDIKAAMNVDKVESFWLDVEEVYQMAGWSVDFDRPGFNESYDSTYKFTH